MSAYNEATHEKEMGSFGNQKGKIWINRREKLPVILPTAVGKTKEI